MNKNDVCDDYTVRQYLYVKNSQGLSWLPGNNMELNVVLLWVALRDCTVCYLT